MSAPDLKKFEEEARTLVDAGSDVELKMSWGDALCVLSALQLALRHPGYNGPTRVVVETWAHELADQIALTPTVKQVVELGWAKVRDPKQDAWVHEPVK